MMVSAATCQMLDQVLYLFISGVAILDDCSCEVQGLTCERVVSVDGDTVFLDLLDFGHELVVFIIHQGDNCALEDILVVEMTVDHENIATQFVYTLGLKISKSLRRLQDKIEFGTLFQLHNLLFEGIQGNTETCDKLKWAFVTSLLFQILLSISEAVQLVNHRHELVFLLFHIPYYI